MKIAMILLTIFFLFVSIMGIIYSLLNDIDGFIYMASSVIHAFNLLSLSAGKQEQQQ